jgi:AAA15 family ATPase/GTPase
MFPYTRLREHKDHVHDDGKVPVLKATAIYGANGAGKSNLVKAMHYVQELLGISPLPEDKRRSSYFKLRAVDETKVSTFEFEFKIDELYLAYGLEILRGEIKEEWLYQLLPGSKQEQKLLFERKGDVVSFDTSFRKNEEEKITNESVTKNFMTSDAPLLPILAKIETNLVPKRAMFWFAERLYVVFPHSTVNSLPMMVERFAELGAFVNEVLPKLDTGVESVILKKDAFDTVFGVTQEKLKDSLKTNLPVDEFMRFPGLSPSPVIFKNKEGDLIVSRLVTTRTGAEGETVEFELSQESDGTQRLLELLAPLFSMINTQSVIVIDELGRSLHPVLLKSLVGYLMRTPMKGQLIFTTHEEHLLDLDIFRKDEIAFLDKDKGGNTKLSKLSEYKARKDLDIQKGFVVGRFGAVPVTRKLDFENAGYVTAD